MPNKGTKQNIMILAMKNYLGLINTLEAMNLSSTSLDNIVNLSSIK